MRKAFTLLVVAFLTATLWGQTPQKMSYQAVIRNANGALVTNTQIGMEINIRQDSISGNIVYTETQTPTTNANGLVSIEIGGSAGFSTINWGASTYYIETRTAIVSPLTNYTITGASQLLSVPYALHAKTAESVTTGGDFTHSIGELFGGGIVIAVWKENGVEHGLIASLTDLSYVAPYSNYTNVSIGYTAQSPTDGQANTSAIITQGSVYGAGLLCENYSSGGFIDWYLPAAWELYECFKTAYIVNSILGTTNGFKFSSYWSSTESSSNYAYSMNFRIGVIIDNFKGDSYNVRAVRRF